MRSSTISAQMAALRTAVDTRLPEIERTLQGKGDYRSPGASLQQVGINCRRFYADDTVNLARDVCRRQKA